MDSSTVGFKESAKRVKGFLKAQPVESVVFHVHNIQDIIQGVNDLPHSVNINSLNTLIENQASLHRSEYRGAPSTLKRKLDKKGNFIRGFVVYAENMGLAGYSIYYPMINHKGQRASYNEDFFVAESFRGLGRNNDGHNVAKIMHHELCKRTKEEGGNILLWATDNRNVPMQKYATKMGATEPNLMTYNMKSILGAEKSEIDDGKSIYKARRIRPNDIDLIERLGVSPDMIRQNGDLPFKGYIVQNGGAGIDNIVAIVPGWEYFSTFSLTEGITLEPPIITDAYKDTVDKYELSKSLVFAIQESKTKNAKLHINPEDQELLSIWTERFGFAQDSMVGTQESILSNYAFKNGTLLEHAETEPRMTLTIPNDTPVGMRPREKKPEMVQKIA